MQPTFFGTTPREQLQDKIKQMRKDLAHLQQALNILEGKVQANVPASELQPHFSNLYNWCLSAMESFFCMTWAAFDRDKVNATLRDFDTKFKNFTSIRSLRAGH